MESIVKMKTVENVSIFILIISLAGLLYIKKYSYSDIVDEELLFLNPFGPTEKDYQYYSLNAGIYLKQNDSVNTKYFSKKVLEYRNTFNEKQFEKLFSDGNNYWEYKQKKILHYSYSFEATGQIDSAIACLAIGLTNTEKDNFDTEQRFYSLQIKKHGKSFVIKEIENGLNRVYKQDCFMCSDYFYEFSGYKIGIDNITYDAIKNNRTLAVNELLKRYKIER